MKSSNKGQIRPCSRFSQKMKGQICFVLFFYSSRQTNQICPFVFWETLRRANLPFGFIWPILTTFNSKLIWWLAWSSPTELELGEKNLTKLSSCPMSSFMIGPKCWIWGIRIGETFQWTNYEFVKRLQKRFLTHCEIFFFLWAAQARFKWHFEIWWRYMRVIFKTLNLQFWELQVRKNQGLFGYLMAHSFSVGPVLTHCLAWYTVVCFYQILSGNLKN